MNLWGWTEMLYVSYFYHWKIHYVNVSPILPQFKYNWSAVKSDINRYCLVRLFGRVPLPVYAKFENRINWIKITLARLSWTNLRNNRIVGVKSGSKNPRSPADARSANFDNRALCGRGPLWTSANQNPPFNNSSPNWNTSIVRTEFVCRCSIFETALFFFACVVCVSTFDIWIFIVSFLCSRLVFWIGIFEIDFRCSIFEIFFICVPIFRYPIFFVSFLCSCLCFLLLIFSLWLKQSAA